MAGRTVWFPGHMASGERELLKVISKLDTIVEVRDARAPHLTSSPLIARLSKMMPVFLVLSKRDLATEEGTHLWLDHFAAKGVKAWAYDMKHANLEPLRKVLAKTPPAHRAAEANREVRIAVVGIPNVGKSFFLNTLVGKNTAKVGGIPGITRGVSWYRGNGFLAVDSPGILDPRGGEEVQRRLSWLACTKAEVIGGFDSMAISLINYMCSNDLWSLVEQKWEVTQGDSGEDTLRKIGVRLGCLISGGEVNLELAGRRFVESFATGKLGRVMLELPNNTLN